MQNEGFYCTTIPSLSKVVTTPGSHFPPALSYVRSGTATKHNGVFLRNVVTFSLYQFLRIIFPCKKLLSCPIDVSSVPHWVQHSLVCSVKLFRCVPNRSSQCAINFSMSPSWPADLWALKYAYTLYVPFSFPWNVLYDEGSQISLKLKIMCMLVNKYSCYTPPWV